MKLILTQNEREAVQHILDRYTNKVKLDNQYKSSMLSTFMSSKLSANPDEVMFVLDVNEEASMEILTEIDSMAKSFNRKNVASVIQKATQLKNTVVRVFTTSSRMPSAPKTGKVARTSIATQSITTRMPTTDDNRNRPRPYR